MCKNVQYTFLENIANDGDASVFKGFDNINNENIIIKSFKTESKNIIPKSVLREVSILRKVACKYIARLIDVFYDDENINIVLEDCGNTILAYTMEKEFCLTDRNRITTELIEAINYLHSIGYIHGDINLKNILFDTVTKLIDFSGSLKVHRNTFIYKPAIYVCPYELLTTSTNNCNMKPLDIWMLGCACYFLVTGNPLFSSFDEPSHIEMIKDLERCGSFDMIEGVNTPIKKMVKLSPNKRCNILYIVKKYKSFYEQFNIVPSNICFYELDRHIINVVHMEYPMNVRWDIMRVLNDDNNNSIEALFTTFKNLFRMSDTFDIKNIAICFWLSNKFIKGNEVTIEHLDKYTSKLAETYNTNVKCGINDVYRTLDNLEWDADPYTLYDYIQYIPKIVRAEFILLAILLMVEPRFDTASDLLKIYVINEIFNATLNIPLNRLNTIIAKALSEGYLDTALTSKFYVDALYYFHNCKNEDRLLSFFDENILLWLYNIDFDKLGKII